MPFNPKKRPSLTVDDLGDFFTGPPKEKKARERIRHSYDEPEGMHEEIVAIAEHLGVTIGEVHAALIQHAINNYRSGNLKLQVEEFVTETRLKLPEVI